MSIKTKTIIALVVALVVILAVNPRAVNNIYNTIVGRILLVGLVIFFAKNNITLGLLVALTIITATNQFSPFVEGMETIGEDNVTTQGEIPVLPKSKDAKDEEEGVDKEDIKNAVASKASNSIPVDVNSKSSEEVSAFTSGMLKASALEGFASYSHFPL